MSAHFCFAKALRKLAPGASVFRSFGSSIGWRYCDHLFNFLLGAFELISNICFVSGS